MLGSLSIRPPAIKDLPRLILSAGILIVALVVAGCSSGSSETSAPADNVSVPADDAASPSDYFAALEAWSNDLMTRMEAIEQEESGSVDPQESADFFQAQADAISALGIELAEIEPAAETADAHEQLLAALQGLVELDERIVESLQAATSTEEVFDGPLSGEMEAVGGQVLLPCGELLDVARRLGIHVQLFCGGTDEDQEEESSGEGGFDVEPVVDASGAAPTAATPLPDVAGAVLGDDGVGPQPVGTVNELPDSSYLNFLSEVCFDVCFRDAVFTDPSNPDDASGEWGAGQPFHVRHGFINNGEEPLADGFDLVIYVSPMDNVSETGGVVTGPTSRYTSDYVLRGTSDECGPTYRTQTAPETCEWFVHDFPDGLPEGRHALWAVWEAPCSAWLEIGFTDSCDDPSEVLSLFSSGVDSAFSGG